MIKSKFWKLQSNEKLNSKVANTLSPTSSPGSLKKTESITFQSKEEFEQFSLNPSNSRQNKEQQPLQIDSERIRLKSTQSIKFQEMHKKSKERQSDRKNKGLASKMKLKLEEQLKEAKNKLEQKQSEAIQLQGEINMFNGLIRERRKHSEDIGNNQQMLKFKENQLNNLITIHNEIMEGAKRQIIKQKLLKTQNEQKLGNLKKKMNDLRSKWREKQQKLYLVQQLNKQKAQLQKYLSDQKAKDREKVQVLAESMRQIIQELIKKNKKAVEQECEWKVRIIREVEGTVKNVSLLKEDLQSKGITPSTYYTYNQLKRIPELNFKANKQAEKIFQILNKQVNPKIIEIIEHFQQPKELLQLKVELMKIEELKLINDAELKGKQKEVEELQMKKRNLQMSFGDKKKSQIK